MDHGVRAGEGLPAGLAARDVQHSGHAADAVAQLEVPELRGRRRDGSADQSRGTRHHHPARRLRHAASVAGRSFPPLTRTSTVGRLLVRQDGRVSAAPTRRRPAFAELVRRPRYPSFVLTVLLSRCSAAMFITSGVLLVLARTGSAPLAGATAAAAVLPGAL